MYIQIYAHFFSEHLVTSYSINLLFINEPQYLGIQFAYITCCYVRQASGKLSGCQEQPLFERYA